MQHTQAIRPARIKDVAARAGVSLKTVTNVVHARPNVSPETRERVQDAIDALGYRPSMAGRQLQSGRSHMLTLAVPRIDEPYLGALAHALIAAAEPRGYSVVMDETLGRLDREARAAEGYPGHGMDGVIFSPIVLDPEAMAERSRHTPMVLLGEPVAGGFADYVAIDNVASAADLVDHLVAGGRRRFLFVGSAPDRVISVGAVRHQAVVDRVRTHGLETPLHLAVSPFTRELGRSAVATLGERLRTVDAIVCGSDLLALGAIRAVHEAGMKVPDDVAVAGWDNIVDCDYVSPTLTSIAPDLKALAATALDALIARIEGTTGTARTYVVPHDLVIRASTAPISPL